MKIAAPEDDILRYLEKQIITKDNPVTAPVLEEVIEDSYKRLIAPAIERDIRNELTEKAEDGAIRVFGKNLNQLLMQPPIAGKVVLGWDPAFRTGCKLAVVDATGKVLDTTVVYPTAPTTEKKIREAKDTVKKLIRKYHVSLISLGNGTASRESEQVIVDLLKEINEPVPYVIVNEAGASVYSASKLATEEFPNFDVGQRSAASIARRLQDPLAELVKIDPKSIGVGQYQHDMNQKKLGEALDRRGGGLREPGRRGSEHRLCLPAGVYFRHLQAHRKKYCGVPGGKWPIHQPQTAVKGGASWGRRLLNSAQDSLRITGGDNPLDATSVHPESYDAATKLLSKLGYSPEGVEKGNLTGIVMLAGPDAENLSKELEIGEHHPDGYCQRAGKTGP